MKYFRDQQFIDMVGKRVAAQRKAISISQEELANRAGFEQKQIGRIERGEVNTSISHIAAIAKALNVDPKDLFDFRGS